MTNDLFIKSIRLAENISPAKFDSYPLNINALRNFVSLKFTSPVTIFNGENGCGKSTLIEAIAENLGISVNGGNSNFIAILGGLENVVHENSDLAQYLLIGKNYTKPYRTFFLRAESFHEISSVIDNDDWINRSNYSEKDLLTESHGESFMDLIRKQFMPDSLFILDEPESALSPENQLKLLCIIDKYACQGSQFIMATHSPILLGYKNAKIINLDDGMKIIKYKETKVYKIYKQFLDNPENFQTKLFENYIDN